MYPNTTAFYCGSVVDSTTYCRNQDEWVLHKGKGQALCEQFLIPFLPLFHFNTTLPLSIVVVQFDGDEDDKGIVPQRHIPARFVTLIPREFPAAQIKRKKKSNAPSSLDVDASRKRERSSISTPKNPSLLPNSAPSSASPLPPTIHAAPIKGNSMNDGVLLSKPIYSSASKFAALAGYNDAPLKLPPKRKSPQANRSKKQKQGDKQYQQGNKLTQQRDTDNPNLASSYF